MGPTCNSCQKDDIDLEGFNRSRKSGKNTVKNGARPTPSRPIARKRGEDGLISTSTILDDNPEDNSGKEVNNTLNEATVVDPFAFGSVVGSMKGHNAVEAKNE